MLREVPAGSQVLEVGPGRGAWAARLARRYRYVGVETDPESVAVTSERVAAFGGQVVNGVADDLDPDRLFDLVCAFEVIEHVEDDAAVLASWVRRLRPGGRLLLSTPAHADRMGPADELAGHYRRYDPPELAELLGAAGLTSVRVRTYGFPLGYALEAARNTVAARRGAPTDKREGTAGSSRFLQPDDEHATLTWLATAPFRAIQRAFADTGLGTGLVADGVVPRGR